MDDELSAEWRDHAACVDVPTAVFYPARDDGLGEAVAKAVCAICPVRPPCRQYAIDNNIDDGVWGGEGENIRRRRRRVEKAVGQAMDTPPPQPEPGREA